MKAVEPKKKIDLDEIMRIEKEKEERRAQEKLAEKAKKEKEEDKKIKINPEMKEVVRKLNND